MKSLIFVAFSIFIYALPSVHAEVEAGLECAITCLNQTLPESPCSASDQACLCENVLLSPPMELCLSTTCNFLENLITRNTTSKVCNEKIRHRGEIVSTSGLVFGSVAVVCIALRFVSRPNRNVSWGDTMDDWVMVINALFIITMTMAAVELVHNGYGRDLYTLTLDEMPTLLKFLYVSEICWSTILTLTRISILLFYQRVMPFEVLPVLRRVIQVTLVCTVAMGLVITVPLIFQCNPLHDLWYIWETGPQGVYCVDLQKHAWATGAVNMASDLWLVLLPIPSLMKLRLKWRKKLGVGLMFSFGGFVTLASIPRIISLVQFRRTADPTWDWVYVTFWSAAEAYIGVICACLPRIYTLISRIYRHFVPKEISEQPLTCPNFTPMTTSTVNSMITPAMEQSARVNSTTSYLEQKSTLHRFASAV